VQGKNDGGKIGYMGPAPPSGTHRYFFRLYALDAMLDLAVRATNKEVSDALKGHVIAQAELMGTYERKARAA
jgi:Raf kinase inhibitor-like YbhB/YbcL family protein